MRKLFFVLKLLLVLCMLAFIWGHSMMPADLSQLESGWFLELVRPLVEAVQRVLESRGVTMTQDYLVRKMAHFTEYAVLGALMMVLFTRRDMRCRVILPALACLAVAFIDEGIQMFAEGRGPGLNDVALDFAGACAGMLAAGLVIGLLYLLFRPRGRHAAGRKRRRS